jgi:hypothetical protein
MPHPLRDASSTGRWNLFPKPSFTINKRLSSVQSRSTLSRTLVGESIARTGSIRSQPRKEQTLTSFAAVHHNGPANNSVLSPFKTDNRRRQINHTVNVAEKSLFRICRTRLDAELPRASLTCQTAALQYWDRSSSPAEMPIENHSLPRIRLPLNRAGSLSASQRKAAAPVHPVSRTILVFYENQLRFVLPETRRRNSVMITRTHAFASSFVNQKH